MAPSTIMTAPALNLYSEAFTADPQGVLRSLREQSWQAATPIGTAVLRYDEVQALLGDRRLRTPGADFLAMQGITDGPLVETMRGFLLNTDGEPHNRVRRLVSKAFTVRRVEDYRATIRRVAGELVDGMAEREECDFVEAFADPFALRVLCGFVGIPVDVQVQVRDWTSDIGLI
ncbi:MAG: cytochrome P450, partial [Actinomycetes bacterium]